MGDEFSDSGKTRPLGGESEISSKLAPTGRELRSFPTGRELTSGWSFHFSRCLEGVVVMNNIIGIEV